MKITRITARTEHFPLVRPYTIAFRSIAAVTNIIVELHTDRGLIGLGAASPEPQVTGETLTACQAALTEDSLAWLIGQDVSCLPLHCRELRARLPRTPAASAAIDMALHDLLARQLNLPLVEMLGRAHHTLPTSVTIGIKPVAETLAEAAEHLSSGFRVLKIKLGHNLEEDLERLRRLRQHVGREVVIRVDPNQGYNPQQLIPFMAETEALHLEFLEQPVPVAQTNALRTLPEMMKARIAVDESLLDETDALNLITPPKACGIFNVKLMKCGGLRPALRIATLAETAGIELMWGCMDESCISISAALHAALSSPATRYLDLDGSFDLQRDIAEGGFVLEDGCLRTLDRPGLGVSLRE